MMRFFLAVLVATAITTAQAQIQFDLRRQPRTRTNNKRRGSTYHSVRRDETVPINLRHDDGLGVYFVTAIVGTPGQTLDLQVRSDQALSWFPSSNSTYCIQDLYRTCAEHGSCTSESKVTSIIRRCVTNSPDSLSLVNQNLSSTFQITTTEWERSQTLLNGTRRLIEKGYIFNDTLTIDDVSVSNLSMGVSYESGPFNSGILGLGYGGDEMTLPHDNLVVQLVSKGMIPTESYSIWLNGDDAKAGSLLFGAIDTTKYDGDLTIIQFFNTPDLHSRIWLSSLEASSPSGTDVLHGDPPFPLVFAIGTTTTSLPSDLAQHMWAVAGAEYRSDLSVPVISCNLRDSAGSYRFRLGGPEGPLVNVPLENFIMTPSISADWFEESNVPANDSLCIFSIVNTTNATQWWIGEDFLRATYLVVDLYNQEVAIAPQVKYNVTESNIVPFVAHGAEVPSATYAPSQPTETPTTIPTTTFVEVFTSSTYAAAAGFASLTNTPTPQPTQATVPSSGGLSRGAKIGIGVGVPLGVILLGLLAFAFWRYMWSQRPPRYSPEGEAAQPVSELPPKESIVTPELPGAEVSTINQSSPAELSPSTSPGLSSMRFGSPSEGYADIYTGQRSESVAGGRNMSQNSDYISELDAGTDVDNQPGIERSGSSRATSRWSFGWRNK